MISLLKYPLAAALAVLLNFSVQALCEDREIDPSNGNFLESFVESQSPETETEDVTTGGSRDPGETAADRGEMQESEEPELDTNTTEETEDNLRLQPATPEAVEDNSDNTPRILPEINPEPALLDPPQEKPALSPQMTLLQWKVREALAWHFEHPQRVSDRSPWGIMHAMLPYGVDSEIIDANGRRQNAVGFLCFNNSARGQRLFYLDKGHIAANVGPGLQGHHGQFLAMLAQSKVAPTYPLRIEGKSFTVADLIAYEQSTCEANTELTFKLIALAHYLPHHATWKNRRGEDWDLPRLIREELKQPVVGAACGGTHRMMGFSFTTLLHQKRKHPLEGQWLRADKYVQSYHDYALTLQNRDGSFSTNWFASRGELPDPQRRLQTSGHILEWLVYSLPKEKLTEPQVVKGVEYIAKLLNEGRKVTWEIGPLGHALHALALYDERVFEGQPGQRRIQLSRENRIPPATKNK